MPEPQNDKVTTAIKWSTFTELGAKLIAPIVSMVLARLLAPEAFGVVSSLSIIISFSEIITDAGFQKFMIQHEFGNDEDLFKSAHVAFWSNFICGWIVWLVIALFRDILSAWIGSPGLGCALMVAALAIPMTSFYSIPVALLKRSLDFKQLFKIRMVGLSVPLLVTLPLAFLLRNYWALVIGTLAYHVVTAITLILHSQWRPSFYFSWERLREMFSFSMWSVFESLSIWLTGYVDLFIVATALDQSYLGLYKTSTMVVGQIMGVVTSITTPVLFSALSRLQRNRVEFQKLFFHFQKVVALFVMPMGVLLYGYHDWVTRLFLGEQWMSASMFLGLWGLSSAVMIVFAHYASELYRSLGKPRLSAMAQWMHIVFLWPVVWWAVREGFETLCVARTFVRLQAILVNLFLVWYVVKISPCRMIKNVLVILGASLVLLAGVLLFQQTHPTFWMETISIPMFALFFVGLLMFSPRERVLLSELMRCLVQRLRS